GFFTRVTFRGDKVPGRTLSTACGVFLRERSNQTPAIRESPMMSPITHQNWNNRPGNGAGGSDPDVPGDEGNAPVSGGRPSCGFPCGSSGSCVPERKPGEPTRLLTCVALNGATDLTSANEDGGLTRGA